MLGFLDHLLASEYPINEATVPPSAGKIPINEPIPEERKIVLKQYLKSSLVGSFTAFIATLLKIWLVNVDWTNISLIAKRPTTTGIKPIPSVNWPTPKVNLSTEVIMSFPTVDNKIPKAPASKFLTGLPSPMEASIVRPKIAKAKYSGWPNS